MVVVVLVLIMTDMVKLLLLLVVVVAEERVFRLIFQKSEKKHAMKGKKLTSRRGSWFRPVSVFAVSADFQFCSVSCIVYDRETAC